jgi:hypothetical protein
MFMPGPGCISVEINGERLAQYPLPDTVIINIIAIAIIINDTPNSGSFLFFKPIKDYLLCTIKILFKSIKGISHDP